jgi:hypothetical protein
MGLNNISDGHVTAGIMNNTHPMESSMEEDSGLVAGIVIGVVTIVLILASLVSISPAFAFLV